MALWRQGPRAQSAQSALSALSALSAALMKKAAVRDALRLLCMAWAHSGRQTAVLMPGGASQACRSVQQSRRMPAAPGPRPCCAGVSLAGLLRCAAVGLCRCAGFGRPC